MISSRNLAVFWSRFFFCSVKEIGSYLSLSSLTELSRWTWLRLEICYAETYLLNCPEEKQVNRKTGKSTVLFFFLLFLVLFSYSLGWSSWELLEVWEHWAECREAVQRLSASGHFLYCASCLHSLQLLKSCTWATSYVLVLVSGTFLEWEYPKLIRACYDNA